MSPTLYLIIGVVVLKRLVATTSPLSPGDTGSPSFSTSSNTKSELMCNPDRCLHSQAMPRGAISIQP